MRKLEFKHSLGIPKLEPQNSSASLIGFHFSLDQVITTDDGTFPERWDVVVIDKIIEVALYLWILPGLKVGFCYVAM